MSRWTHGTVANSRRNSALLMSEPSADDEVDLGGDDDLGVETSSDEDENN